jgi:hypothetical protein
MLSDNDLCCVIIAVSASRKKMKGNARKKGRRWSKQWFNNREKFTNGKLINELRMIEPNDFRNCVRKDGEIFDELLALVTSAIGNSSALMCDAIPSTQHLPLKI